MEFTLELFTILLNILSVIVIPVLMIFYNKLNKIEQLYVSLRDDVNRIYEVSNQNDKELLTHWLYFYNNEIIRFNERLKTKPDHVPTQEHYKSVFNNYERYKELEGNGYIDAIMANVYALYRIHYGFDEQEKK